MNVGKITPVISGNYKLNKAQKSQSNATNSISSTSLMSQSTANALKAQITFKGNNETSAPKGITVGWVEDKPAINVVLNGENKIKNNLYYEYEGYAVKSRENNGRREFVMTHKDKPVLEGFISNDLGNDTKIEFKSAKHKPEIKVTLKDGSTVQLLEGSRMTDVKGNFDIRYPGKYKIFEDGEATSRKVISGSSGINFTGNFVSLLCKKDATINATNNSKEVPFITSGVHYETVKNDDPTFVVLAGGFGTRFANMTTGTENKPSFVMPNGHSILSSAYDLVKNATAAEELTDITYLEQNSGSNPAATKGMASEDSTIIPMDAFKSDGGAVIRAVINGDIPNDKPLVILNADTITNIDVSQAYEKLKTLKNAAMVIPRYPVSETRAKSFGLMAAGSLVDKDGSRVLTNFVEKPKNPKEEATAAMIEGKTVNGEQAYYGNPGIYIFSPEVLQNLDLVLETASDIALEKAIAKAIENDEVPPTELKDKFSSSTFLGNAFVPAIVKLCEEGKLTTEDGNAMRTYMVPMLTTTEQEAYWDDIGAAEAFVNVCQDIAYETKQNGTGAANKFYGIRGIEDISRSVDTAKGIVYASPEDRDNFEARHAHKFEIKGDVYITCKK